MKTLIFDNEHPDGLLVDMSPEMEAQETADHALRIATMQNEDAVLAAKLADFSELKDAKLQAALTALASHQTKLEGAPTNAQVIAAVLYLVKVMTVIIRVVSKQV
jgi:hypothetical protein